MHALALNNQSDARQLWFCFACLVFFHRRVCQVLKVKRVYKEFVVDTDLQGMT